MDLVASFVRNPVKVAVGVLLVALFGVIALLRMPMQLVPEVQTPTITIETRWPGASPEEVEREIVQEQEEQLKGVEGMIKMSGSCTDSQGTLTLEFVVGTDMSSALLRVNSRLQQVPEYPEEADEPVITTANSSDQPIGWFILRPRVVSIQQLEEFAEQHPDLRADLERAIGAHNTGLRLQRLRAIAAEHPVAAELLPPADLDVTLLKRFAEDNIEARFERVPGVANANVFGGRDVELQIVVDPQRLAARDITIAQLRVALSGRNQDTSAGDFWEGKRRYVVRTMGQLRSIDEVEDLIVARRGGLPVYVRDVADVRIGHKKPNGIVRNFGSSAIACNAIRETGANVIDVMEGLREAVADLNEGILAERGLQLEQVYDETDYINSAVGLVRSNLAIGGALTIVVLLLFLRSARSTLVIALAIPTSIIGTFLLLDLMGRSLNVISLAGLAFAVGMLVDNAVVVLENIFRRYQAGERRAVAAVKGTKEVWGAVVSSTLTTLAVFLPVLFVEEEAGQLFRDIALAISCSVGLSLIVSVTLIPTAARRLLADTHAEQGRFTRLLNRLFWPFDRLGAWFVAHVVRVNAFVQRGVVRQIVVVVLLVALAVGSVWALFPDVEYLPTGNRNLVFGIMLPPPGYNLDELVGMGQKLEDYLEPYWNVDAGDPAIADLDYPAIQDFFFVAFGRRVILGIRAQDPLRSGELVPLVMGFRNELHGTFVVAQQSSLFESGLAGGRTIDIEFTGPELRRLVGMGGRALGQVYATFPPGTQARPDPSLDLSNPEVHVRPDWEKAADMGVTAVGLGYTVNSLVDGAYAGDYYLEGDKIDITILGEKQYAGNMQEIANLPIAVPTGELVPLRALADVRLASGPEQINRRERERAITIKVTPPPTLPLETAMTRIDREILDPMRADGTLGGAHGVNLAGTADKLRATWSALQFNVILALIITYLLMAALFESWLYPFVIILSVPLGAAGGFIGLAVLNTVTFQALDVLTMLGFVILIGTVVNNAILIVHQSLNHMREEEMESGEAVLKSVASRIRPIFMTLSTTVFGLLPLVVFPGAGSELYRGLGSILIGGLVVSTMFTLLLVPTLFQLMMTARASVIRGLRRLGGASTVEVSPAEA